MISQQTQNEIQALIDRLKYSPNLVERKTAMLLCGVLGAARVPSHLDELVAFHREFSARCIKDLTERVGR